MSDQTAESFSLLPENYDNDPCVGPWKCFFCGEVLTTESQGQEHFGVDESQKPGCVDRLTPEEFVRIRRARWAEWAVERNRAIADRAEAEATAVAMERHDLWRFGREVTTVGQAFQKYDNEIGKNEAALHFIAAIERLAPLAVAAAREELKLYPDAYRVPEC